jgi:hypothetical protein
MEEFYRVPFTSGEALVVLATLKAVARLTDAARGGVDTDLEPGILPSALERFTEEVPEYLAGQADRLAGAVERSFREALAAGNGMAGGSDEEERTAPPFPIGRSRRLLEDAFDRRVPVEIEYFVRSRNEWTTRRVDITDVYDDKGAWLLAGRCGMRDDYRQFRLDHIRAVRVLDGDDGVPDPFDEE